VEGDVALVRYLANWHREIRTPKDRADIRTSNLRRLGQNSKIRRARRVIELFLAEGRETAGANVVEHHGLGARLGCTVLKLFFVPFYASILGDESSVVRDLVRTRLVEVDPARAASRVDGWKTAVEEGFPGGN
jgi:hypothetical protein